MATPPPDVFTVLKALGISQRHLARALDVPQGRISAWANGKRPVPPFRLHDLWALASVAREDRAAGKTVRHILANWHPTRLVWRTAHGQEVYSEHWVLPAEEGGADEDWGLDVFRRVLLQPGGPEVITLYDAVKNLHPYHAGVVQDTLAGKLPSAADVEMLRQTIEAQVAAIHRLQELIAQQPLEGAGSHVDETG
jgi:transcriptional regulator with XRE-family HTH domain